VTGTYNGILLCLLKDGYFVMCNNMNEHREHYAQRKKSTTERQLFHDFNYMRHPEQSNS
jgi:hypothetical protein